MKKPQVTPFAGVWIEIIRVPSPFTSICVTPFAGVWIEIVLIRWTFIR